MAQVKFHVCYHCKNRTIGCHAKCEAYQKEKALNEKERVEKNKQHEIDSALYRNTGHRMSVSKRKR